jgi:hypothetical protein
MRLDTRVGYNVGAAALLLPPEREASAADEARCLDWTSNSCAGLASSDACSARAKRACARDRSARSQVVPSERLRLGYRNARNHAIGTVRGRLPRTPTRVLRVAWKAIGRELDRLGQWPGDVDAQCGRGRSAEDARSGHLARQEWPWSSSSARARVRQAAQVVSRSSLSAHAQQVQRRPPPSPRPEPAAPGGVEKRDRRPNIR